MDPGLTGALEAADANVNLYEAEVEFIRSRYGLAIGFLNLRMALGLDPFGKEHLPPAGKGSLLPAVADTLNTGDR